MPHVLALISVREVMSRSFQDDTLKPRAQDIAEDMITSLLPHLMLYTKKHGQRPVANSTWGPAFVDFLSRAIKEALYLKARLQVAPQKYEMMWHQPGAEFNRAEMIELNRREEDFAEAVIGICILPGWRKDGMLIRKATVTLA
jgi:hypothetical protein